ncbi:ubiquitin carboxyl-terminal hydrolase 40-like [Anguilla anguilla]|uniref:ubiquitin carboxyl-terminal hydrolase 40-like n=1 Tax=Anguilla anguilla TaxID=7936 RepID=UPI0015AC1AEF|nr:ubiquitin carboxyl-terminal hydrolase 40-like [Anguilla anguilla]
MNRNKSWKDRSPDQVKAGTATVIGAAEAGYHGQRKHFERPRWHADATGQAKRIGHERKDKVEPKNKLTGGAEKQRGKVSAAQYFLTENDMCSMDQASAARAGGHGPGKDPNPKTYSGVRNQGSTFYLNTVLQILFMTDECRQAVMRLNEADGKTVSKQLKKLFENLERNQVPDTSGIIHSLGITDVYRQEDASECFQKILSEVNPDISKIYEGTIEETVTCKKGHQLKNSSSPFTLIPLSFNNPSSGIISVEDAWTDHFKTTNTTLYCNDCNRDTSAKFESKISECPQILVLHLDRLNFHSGRKNTCQVKIEPTCSVEGWTYELYAIANHHGSPWGSRYNAFIKPYGDKCWWLFDDSHVRKMEEWKGEHLNRSDAADMLFYKKITLEEENRGQKHHTEEGWLTSSWRWVIWKQKLAFSLVQEGEVISHFTL